jgi:hypothetical protein
MLINNNASRGIIPGTAAANRIARRYCLIVARALRGAPK